MILERAYMIGVRTSEDTATIPTWAPVDKDGKNRLNDTQSVTKRATPRA